MAFLAISCATRLNTIPEGLTQMELIQRGQEASDRNRYNISLQYYEALIMRFPFDIDSVIAAEYEIAFIHYKQRQYDLAKAGFENLLARYNVPDAELLPPQFKILALIVMDTIAERESQVRRGRS